jgi:hypothetical protein
VTNQARSLDLDLQEKRVATAIDGRGNQLEAVSRRLSFGPKPVASAAEERHLAATERVRAGVAIHKAEHQHFPGRGILHDGRRQALHVVKIYFPVHGCCPWRKNKKPAERKSHHRASNLFRCYASSANHPRQCALRMMVVMTMSRTGHEIKITKD